MKTSCSDFSYCASLHHPSFDEMIFACVFHFFKGVVRNSVLCSSKSMQCIYNVHVYVNEAVLWIDNGLQAF